MKKTFLSLFLILNFFHVNACEHCLSEIQYRIEINNYWKKVYAQVDGEKDTISQYYLMGIEYALFQDLCTVQKYHHTMR